MARFARIDTGRVAEIVDLPDGMSLEIHPAMAAAFVACPDPAVVEGWSLALDGDGKAVFSAPVVVPPTPAQLVAYAAAKRFAVETGGLEVNGLTVATDRDSQSMIANAFAGMQASGAASVKFKAASGWIELTAEQIKAVALAVFAHVQACFTAEDAADAAIHATPATITTFAAVDAAFAGLGTA
ncbi:DUF4376 domain-containing protein [Methylobacterium fujisawaense]|uniref:DUF4376 domain-containing protein n=1 Tax=Methylobacterium fujisawaense TaxID=107400 RepID=UPI00313A809E